MSSGFRAVASFPVAVASQAVARWHSPGTSGVASATASLSMAALSCFCNSMNAGAAG